MMITVHDLEADELLEMRAALQDLGGRATLRDLTVELGMSKEYSEFLEAGLLEAVVDGGLPFAVPSAEHGHDGHQVWKRLDLAEEDDYAVASALLRSRAEEAMRHAAHLDAEARRRAAGAD